MMHDKVCGSKPATSCDPATLLIITHKSQPTSPVSAPTSRIKHSSPQIQNKPIIISNLIRLSRKINNMSADPSIDPSLARSAVDAAFGPQHSHLQPQELFYDATDDPTAFQLANAAIQGTEVSAIAAAAAVAA